MALLFMIDLKSYKISTRPVPNSKIWPVIILSLIPFSFSTVPVYAASKNISLVFSYDASCNVLFLLFKIPYLVKPSTLPVWHIRSAMSIMWRMSTVSPWPDIRLLVSSRVTRRAASIPKIRYTSMMWFGDSVYGSIPSIDNIFCKP